MYVAVTNNISVEVTPVFVPERSDCTHGLYFFAYTIRIANMGEQACQLLSRHWIIRDGRGREEHVVGEGVVGEQPVIAAGGVFEYTSACPLRTPTGNMRGTYTMSIGSGEAFKVRIPMFFLRNAAEDGPDVVYH